MDRRTLFGFLSTSVLAPLGLRQASAATETKMHKLSFHVDQNDPAVMNLTLGNAKNAYEHFHERGEEIAAPVYVADSEHLRLRAYAQRQRKSLTLDDHGHETTPGARERAAALHVRARAR